MRKSGSAFPDFARRRLRSDALNPGYTLWMIATQEDSNVSNMGP